MRLRNVCVLSNFVAALAATWAGAAMSQDYPMRPVRIVTAPAGGGSDQAARLVAQGLSPLLGQQVIGGCTFDDVVDVTSFHTNPEKQFETFMRVKSEVFSDAPLSQLDRGGRHMARRFRLRDQNDCARSRPSLGT